MRYFSDTAGDLGEGISRLLQTVSGSALSEAVSDTDFRHPLSFAALPFSSCLEEVRTSLSVFPRDSLRFVIVVGIGGSALGARAAYDAARSVSSSDDSAARLLFIEGFERRTLEEARDTLIKGKVADEEIVIMVISKSGKTIETVFSAQAVFQMLDDVIGDVMKRTVFVTMRGSPLWEEGVRSGAVCIPVPRMISGRFSIFSAVGLAPLFLAGIAVDRFIAGARDVTHDFIRVSADNPSFRSACILFNSALNGYAVHDTFLFGAAFESLGKWYRQLQAESLGKPGKSAPLAPTVSVGTADLHSITQFALNGPSNRLTTFVTSTTGDAGDISGSRFLSSVLGELKQPETVNTALYTAAVRAWRRQGLPFTEIHFEDTVPDIGAFMQHKMLETVFLSSLLGVNPFTQDAVEEYKLEALRLLSL